MNSSFLFRIKFLQSCEKEIDPYSRANANRVDALNCLVWIIDLIGNIEKIEKGWNLVIEQVLEDEKF